MKRFLCLALVLALLMITLPVRAEKLTALWTANPKISAPIYIEPSTQSKTLGRIYQGASVKVYSFDPEWAYINSSGVVGYVLRRHRWLQRVEMTIMLTIFVMLFVLGLTVGGNEYVVENLPSLGGLAALIALVAMTGSAVLVSLVYHFFFKERGGGRGDE